MVANVNSSEKQSEDSKMSRFIISNIDSNEPNYQQNLRLLEMIRNGENSKRTFFEDIAFTDPDWK